MSDRTVKLDLSAGSTAAGGTGGGRRPGGNDPNRTPPGKGDTDMPLYRYPRRSAHDHILEWLNAQANLLVSRKFLITFAQYLFELQRRGIALGPVVRTAAMRKDSNHDLSVARELDIANPDGLTVGQFFGLGTKRGYYDTNIAAGMQQAAKGSRAYGSDTKNGPVCGRCASPTAGKVFKTYRQTT